MRKYDKNIIDNKEMLETRFKFFQEVYMQVDYDLLLKHYNELIKILQFDEREVSKEMIQVIYDDIEDSQIRLGNASQIQPSINGIIGYKIPS